MSDPAGVELEKYPFVQDRELGIWNAGQVSYVEGAEWVKSAADHGKIRIKFSPGRTEGYARQKVVFHFTAKHAEERAKSNPS